MKKIFTRIIATVLCAVMVIGAIPSVCFSCMAFSFRLFAATEDIPDIKTGWYWPLDKKWDHISSWFGYRKYKDNSGKWHEDYHQGIDICKAKIKGAPVYAARKGVVAYVDKLDSGGNIVSIKHGKYNGDTIYTTYMHLRDKGCVYVGQEVDNTTVIGYVGGTGGNYTPHLHFQICKNNKNPKHRTEAENNKNYFNPSYYNISYSYDHDKIEHGKPNIQWTGQQVPPAKLPKGKSYGLHGLINSHSDDYPLTNVTAIVKNTDYPDTDKRSTVYNISVPLNQKTYDIKTGKINKDIVFKDTNKFPDGHFSYTVIAKTNYSGAEGTHTFGPFPFTIGNPANPQPKPPEFKNITPIPGGYSVELKVESGAEIMYSTTSNNPTTKYSGKFTVKSSCTIYAVAKKNGVFSGTVSQPVTVNQVATPTINAELTSRDYTVTIDCKTSGAKIYYTLNSTKPSTSACIYSGPIHLTSGAVVRAYAVKDGCIDSKEADKQQITVKAPLSPGLEIPTGDAVAIGDPIELKWTRRADATSYQVRVYRNKELIETVNASGSGYAYIPQSAGEYTFGVDALNFVGKTASDSTRTIAAKDPVTVRFVNADGTLIEEQTVRYGYSATAPETPKQKGWVFLKWDKSYQHVTEDVTVTAVYERQKYVVRFIDQDGVTCASPQEVAYEGAVSLPATPTIGIAGYAFMGWRAISADASSKLDYTCVDADMTLQAVFGWENANLPVAVQSATVTANDDGRSYTADYKLNNGTDQTVYCRVVITLKTSTGKAVTTDVRDVTVPANGTYIPKENTEIICDKVATEAEINIVGLNEDLTGGAYALPYTLSITKSTYWSDWSTDPANGDGSDESTKTQYSYRTKEKTTSTSSSLAGWDQYGTPTYTDTWGNWGSWTTTRESTSELKQEEAKAQYRYYYYKCQNCGGRLPYYNYTCPLCKKVKVGNNWNCIWSTTRYKDTAWYNWDSAKRYTYSVDGTQWFFGTGNTNDTAVGTKDSASSAVVIRQAYRYRTATRTYTYYYYRWGDWSSWSDSPVSATSDRQVQTRLLYRHIDLATTDGEDNTGETYTVSGTLPTTDDNSSFAGKNAIIFVYKSQINDPTASAIKYVGNTVIGEGNTYDFSFVPSQSPDEAKSNYIVALAVEGQTALMNIDVIRSSAFRYEVEFFADGVSIGKQDVEEGRDAVVPTPPEIPGKVFVGWNNDTTNVLAPRKIEALYADETYSVVFVDFENNFVSMDQYKYGETIALPAVEDVEGKTFLGWEGLDMDNPVATEHAVYIAKYETGTFTVQFDDGYGNILSTQTVEYGKAAELPDAPEKEGMIFMGWSQEQSWWNVKSDMTVSPIWVYEETVSPINVSVENLYFGGEITAETGTEGATIYYAVDDGRGEPPLALSQIVFDTGNDGEDEIRFEENEGFNQMSKAQLLDQNATQILEEDDDELDEDDEPIIDYYEWIPYDDSMIFNVDATIYFYAAADGMNDSEIVTFNYEYVPVENPYEDHTGETYTVMFLDDDGYVLSEQTVNYFEDAVAPEVEPRDGFVFIGWDRGFDHVTEDLEVTAQYVPEGEYVTFALDRDAVTLTAGETCTLQYSATNASEDLGSITWKSSDESVAAVNMNGVIIANRAGEAVITATTENDYSASCKVTVLANTNDTVVLNKNSDLSLEDGMLTRIPILSNHSAATVGEIKDQLATPDVKLFDANGRELADSDPVTTNTQIRIIADGIVIDAVIVIVIGDYDGNGKINNRDAAKLMRYLVNKETPNEAQMYAMDVNKDGEVNNRDAAMISRYLVGKETI